MAQINVVNLKNEKVTTVDLPDDVFSQKVNAPLVLQVIKAQLAGKRQGTASSKTKGLIRGGGKKPFKQKGTGNARQGSSRSPLMPGGGSAFGPLPRKYNQDTPKKMIRGALKSVLSDKLVSNKLVILENFDLKTNKTKDLASLLAKNFQVNNVVVVDSENNKLKLASQNIPLVKYLREDGVNVYDLVRHEWLFLTASSIKPLVQRLS